jgi:hypothetical protein
VDHRKHDDMGCPDLVEDAVGVQRQFADGVVAKFRDDLA